MRTGSCGEDFSHARSRGRALRRIGIVLITLPMLAAAGTVGYSVAHWQGDSQSARLAAAQASTEQLRIDAMVGAFNDATATVEMLREMSKHPGHTGAKARTLLRYLHERSR
jgi:hypothetical protein